MANKFQVKRHPQPLTHVVFVRVTEEEHARIARSAEACEQTINAWAREQLVFSLEQADEDEIE